MITLYHNPRCSKSRQALALLEETGIELHVHRYLDVPLDAEQLRAIQGLLATMTNPEALAAVTPTTLTDCRGHARIAN